MGKYLLTVVTIVALGAPCGALGGTLGKTVVLSIEGDAPAALGAQVVQSVSRELVARGEDAVHTAVPLEEIRLTVDCPEPTPSCTAVVGQNLGAKSLILVRLRHGGGGYQLELTLFDVAEQRPIRSGNRGISLPPRDEEIRAAVERMYMTPYTSATQPIASSTRWKLSLRTRTWAVAAGGLGLLTAAGILGGLTLKAQKDFDAMQSPSPSDPEAVRAFVDQADKGKRYARAANVLFVCGGVTMAVSAYFFVRDFRKVEIRPSVGPQTAGLMFWGRF